MSSFKTLRLPAALLAACLVLGPVSSEEQAIAQNPHHSPSPIPSVPVASDLRPLLSGGDRVATFRTLHLVLSQVEDGATYVWHRGHGRLSGAFKPTRSFRSADGRLCRHLMMQLAAGLYARRSEGIACRNLDGQWSLEG